MAVIFPELENIQRLKVPPTEGEWTLVNYLKEHLDDTYEVFFNPYLDGDRPDIIILKEDCGAFIIEVKDWNLKNFKVSEANKWEVSDGTNSSKKSSPQQQAFRYKKNPNFFNLVHPFVYFHGSNRTDIETLYYPAEQSLKDQQDSLRQSYQQKKVVYDWYENKRLTLDRRKRNIQRDKSISIGSDQLAKLIKKIKQNSKHVLFDEEVYRDFKRRLSPPSHTLNQGMPISFDVKQLPLTQSSAEKRKITGVAGCGKTSILSKRAINAFERHHSPTLILTFNITLKNYIRDKISDLQGSRDFSHFEISNYHQFFTAQLNNNGMDISELINRYGLEKLYSTDVFQGNGVKYQTVLIDEIQDYQPEWVKIIRDNFLSEDGEMILFGDESQNIYQREVGRSPVIAQGFGRWIKIKRSYRTDFNSPLNQLFKDFQLQFLVEKYADTEVFDIDPAQIGMSFSLLKYEPVSDDGWKESIFTSVQSYIKSYDLHPNDVVILSSKISIVRQLNALWSKNEKTHCMFETYEELAACTNKDINVLKSLDEEALSTLIKNNKEDIERVRRAKKNHFYANSGLIKLSTIHSFKGLESKTVFYIMSEEDDPEVVYTSLTRSSENLVIFDRGNKNSCSTFLSEHVK